MSAVQKKRLHLCGSCLGLVVLADDERDVCRHCGAADEEGPCGCEEGGCIDTALDLLDGAPYPAHHNGTLLHDRYYQRGVNWTRRGVSGEPVAKDQLLPYSPCDPRGACRADKTCWNHDEVAVDPKVLALAKAYLDAVDDRREDPDRVRLARTSLEVEISRRERAGEPEDDVSAAYRDTQHEFMSDEAAREYDRVFRKTVEAAEAWRQR